MSYKILPNKTELHFLPENDVAPHSLTNCSCGCNTFSVESIIRPPNLESNQTGFSDDFGLFLLDGFSPEGEKRLRRNTALGLQYLKKDAIGADRGRDKKHIAEKISDRQKTLLLTTNFVVYYQMGMKDIVFHNAFDQREVIGYVKHLTAGELPALRSLLEFNVRNLMKQEILTGDDLTLLQIKCESLIQETFKLN